MKFEDYVREELDKIEKKIDAQSGKIEKLMVFMAVKTAEDTRKNRYTSAFIAIACSVTSSGIMLAVSKFLGG